MRRSLIDDVLDQGARGPARSYARIDGFLHAVPRDALRIWLEDNYQTGAPLEAPAVLRNLTRQVAQLDELLARQVNIILHAPRFQQLEAAWRGLWLLTEEARANIDQSGDDGPPPRVEIRLLNLTKRELRRDFENAIEFDQSILFRKVYDDGFGQAGAHPFGTLIGDYQFTDHPEDVELLERLAEVAAAAFAPFIGAPAPELLRLDNGFVDLERPIRSTALSTVFSGPDYLKWKSFRDKDDARFVGLVLPRILMRTPYRDDGSRSDGFRFREEVEAPDRSAYLWGNAAFAFGAVLIRAFRKTGWFAEIRGVERGTTESLRNGGAAGGGLVTGLAVDSFRTDRDRVAPKTSLEVAVSFEREVELSELGFIPLCHCHDTEFAMFYSNSSVQKPKPYTSQTATANASMSAALQYILCCSRFAHYLKILARDKVGGLADEKTLQRTLNSWIQEYVTGDKTAKTEVRARRPLQEAKVEVRPIEGRPGEYKSIIHLLPHFQLDGLAASMRFAMQFAKGKSDA